MNWVFIRTDLGKLAHKYTVEWYYSCLYITVLINNNFVYIRILLPLLLLLGENCLRSSLVRVAGATLISREEVVSSELIDLSVINIYREKPVVS